MRCRLPVLSGCLLLSLVFGVPPADAEQDTDATFLTYFDVWNTGELDRLDEIVAPDFRRHGGPDEVCSSREELKELIERTRAIYKHLRFDIEDHMTEQRGGAMRGSFYGVHSEINRIVEFPLMSMVRFEDGLIAEEWTLGNNFLVLVGLGYQLTPPGFEVIEPPRDAPRPEADTATEEGR